MDSGEPAERSADGSIVLKEETGLVLVLLPGGRFLMGAQAVDPSGPNYDPLAQTNEAPVHPVALTPFFLSKYEMTQQQWVALSGSNPSFHPASGNPGITPLHPVEQVSWEDCMRVLPRHALELPSEAQWEYGARGGTTTPWSTGRERESLRGSVNLADQAALRDGYDTWSDIREWPELDDGYANHAPVDRFAPNPFGLHGVHGNVWEPCLDGAPSHYLALEITDAVQLPVGLSARIIRGAGFAHSAVHARSAMRGNASAVLRATYLGVRPARKIEGSIRHGGER